MSEFALRYDMMGSRLCAIGPAELMHTGVFSAPLALGSWQLHHDSAGRLLQVGPYRIDYDMAGTRPRMLGGWPLDYDMLGQRLRQVGPFPVSYHGLGGKPRTVGPMTLRYRWGRQRPTSVELDGPEVGQLPASCLLALYMVLRWQASSSRHSS